MTPSVTKQARQMAEPPPRVLGGGTLAGLFDCRPPETLDADAVLFWEGDSALDLFHVDSGCLRLYRMMADGRRAVTGFMFAGEILGVSFKERYLFTAEAVTKVKLRRVLRTQLHVSLARAPNLNRELLAMVCDELSAAQDQMLLLARKTALERIAHFLVGLSKRAGNEAGEAAIVLPMTRLDIADFLGLTIETVCRVLAKLKSEGLIALPSPHRVILLDLAPLRRLAGEPDDLLSPRMGSACKISRAVWPN